MTFNLWHGGDEGEEPLSQTIKVIRRSGADIVGLQETHGHAPEGGTQQDRPNRAAEIADLLGWHFIDQGGRTGILSRFPIIDLTPARWGAMIELPCGARLLLFNAHLAASPYQPYQLLGIDYHDAPFLTTADEAIAAAIDARGAAVERMLSEMRPALALELPTILTDDFNEPSHLDWTERAAYAGRVPQAIPYPTSLRMTSKGLADGFRLIHPDELEAPGWTWTPITAEEDPLDRHDRIDRIYVTPQSLEVLAAEIVGERAERADIVVTPYPSDHRAVVVTVRLRGGGVRATITTTATTPNALPRLRVIPLILAERPLRAPPPPQYNPPCAGVAQLVARQLPKSGKHDFPNPANRRRTLQIRHLSKSASCG